MSGQHQWTAWYIYTTVETTSETTSDSLLLWLKEQINQGPNNKQNQTEQLLIASLHIYKTTHKYCYIQCVLALQVFNSSAYTVIYIFSTRLSSITDIYVAF